MFTRKLLTLILYILLVSCLTATEKTKELQVLAVNNPPFVFMKSGNVEGFSNDVWQKISDITKIKYVYSLEKSMFATVDMISSNQFDLAVGAFPITLMHEKNVDFSYPLFKSGSVILSLNNTKKNIGYHVLSFIKNIFSIEVIGIILILIVLLFISANIVWLVERKNNPEMFPKHYWSGVWESLWWSSVTITTVGYGDKTPKSVIGRMCALVWMFSGIFIISYFTATISSYHTITHFENKYNIPQDLIGKQVGTVKGAPVSRYLRVIGVRVFEFKSMERAYEALNKKLITAVVFDAPAVKNYVRNRPDNLYLVSSVFNEKYYSFMLPENSPYTEKVNQAIIYLKESGEYNLIYEKWFGKSSV